MNKIKNIIIIILLSVIVFQFASESVSANNVSFRAGIFTLLGSEYNAQNTQEIRDSFIWAYGAEWQKKLADGVYTDTPVNRRNFAANKMLDYLQENRRAYLRQLAVNAVPTPTPLP